MKGDLKSKLDEVNGDIESLRADAQSKWTAFEQARDEFASAGNDATRVDSDEFKKAHEIHEQYGTVAEALAEKEAVRDGIYRMIGDGPKPDVKHNGHVEVKDQPNEHKTVGDRALESEGYKALKESGVLESERRSFNEKIADVPLSEAKALITGLSDTSGGAFVVNDRLAYIPQPRRPLKIVDLITVGETSSDTVEYVKQSTYTHAAAFTAEATAQTTGTKPEATLTFTKVTETVKNLPVWTATTRRALADVGQLRTLIDSQLKFDILKVLEDQIVNGNGSGENLTGILQTSGILSQPKGSDSVADAIHKAVTQIRLGFLEPTGVALHPNDWQVVRLSRDDSGASAGTGGYLFGPPSTAGSEQIWGLPVAVTAAIPDDTGLVGDFGRAVLWMREAMQVYATDSHDDWFIKNLIAILAELRAAFGVLQAEAFCKVTSVD